MASLSQRVAKEWFTKNSAVKALCMGWFEGSDEELLANPRLLRRLVIRAIKELDYRNWVTGDEIVLEGGMLSPEWELLPMKFIPIDVLEHAVLSYRLRGVKRVLEMRTALQDIDTLCDNLEKWAKNPLI